MNVSLNRGLLTVLLILLLVVYTVGLPLYSFLINFFPFDKYFDLSIEHSLMANTQFMISKIDHIIIGIWLFTHSKKLKQDRFLWLLFGLIYGMYSIVFLLIIAIVRNVHSETNLFNSIQTLLVVLIVSVAIELSMRILTMPLLVGAVEIPVYGSMKEYGLYLNFLTTALMFIVNIALALKLREFIQKQKMQITSVWVFSTIILGIFPVILFNELLLIRRIKNAA